jgi:hypothetical protein
MKRLLAVLSACLVLAGCADTSTVEESKPADLGAFRLGHNIVVASKMQKVPISRDATEEEWIENLTSAFADRFERYEGDQLYHFGVSVEGFALAPPGVPLVASPKSALIVNVTVWDDAAGKKLNEEPHQLLVFESLGEGLIVGSGYTNTREEQLENLSFNASRQLERWLAKQHKENGWFAAKDPDAEVAAPAEAVDTTEALPATEDDEGVLLEVVSDDG